METNTENSGADAPKGKEPHNTAAENKTALRLINERLFDLLEAFREHCEELGYINVNAVSRLDDCLSLVGVRYFNNEPDGDREWLFFNEHPAQLSDQEAYDLMKTRVINFVQ